MPAAVTLAVDEDVLARVDALAEERDISREDILQFALADFLDAQSADPGPLLPWQADQVRRGLAAAERGDFASDDEVERAFAQYGA